MSSFSSVIFVLISCATLAVAGDSSASRRQLYKLGASSSNDVITVAVPSTFPAASAFGASGLPRRSQVTHVTTLPKIDAKGHEIPAHAVRVVNVGSNQEVDEGIGKRTVEETDGSTIFSNVKAQQVVPRQGSNTLAGCNVVPPPFRTLSPFEDGTSSMYNGVVSLLFSSSGSIVGFCSGWLVDSFRVVTAAHCVYDHSSKKYYFNQGQTLTVYTGLNGGSSSDSVSRSTVKSVTVSSSYIKHARWSDSLAAGTDVAVLTLANSLSGRKYGWASPSASSARMVLGYPAVSQDGFTQIGDISPDNTTPLSFGCSGTGANILCERVGTEGGHSGSPLFFAYNRDVVVGTLSGGVIGSCPNFFTLAVLRQSTAMSVQGLLESSGCSVSSSGGVLRVSSCRI